VKLKGMVGDKKYWKNSFRNRNFVSQGSLKKKLCSKKGSGLPKMARNFV